MCRPTNALVVSYPATSRQTDQPGMSQRCDEQRETRNKLEFLPRALSRPVSLPRRTITTPASTASASRAWGSQLEHLHGRSRLPARGRCRPSDVTSRVGAVRATGRRVASGRITGVVGAARRRLPTRGPARRQYVFFMVLKCVDLLTPARGAPRRPTVKMPVVLAMAYPQNGNKVGPRA